MESNTIEQILKVIEFAAKKYHQGSIIDQSYQYGVRQASQKNNVAYQTIGDACRRRLDLDNIGEFKSMLSDTFQGDASILKNLLLSKSPKHHHDRIKIFFADLKKTKPITKEDSPDTFVSYTIQLKKKDQDMSFITK